MRRTTLPPTDLKVADKHTREASICLPCELYASILWEWVRSVGRDLFSSNLVSGAFPPLTLGWKSRVAPLSEGQALASPSRGTGRGLTIRRRLRYIRFMPGGNLAPLARAAIIGDGHTYGTVATPLATLIADTRVGALARAVIIDHGYSHGAVVIGHGYSHGAVHTPMATLIAGAIWLL